jgi:predicted phosphodiesterase
VRIPLEDGGELLLVHGSPLHPDEALSFDMSDEEIDALLGDDCGDVVVCGMSHTPFNRSIGGVQVVNVGSIGEAPDGMSTPPGYGTGEYPMVAHATWIESTPQGVVVEQITVPLEAPPRQLRVAR